MRWWCTKYQLVSCMLYFYSSILLGVPTFLKVPNLSGALKGWWMKGLRRYCITTTIYLHVYVVSHLDSVFWHVAYPGLLLLYVSEATYQFMKLLFRANKTRNHRAVLLHHFVIFQVHHDRKYDFLQLACICNTSLCSICKWFGEWYFRR